MCMMVDIVFSPFDHLFLLFLPSALSLLSFGEATAAFKREIWYVSSDSPSLYVKVWAVVVVVVTSGIDAFPNGHKNVCFRLFRRTKRLFS